MLEFLEKTICEMKKVLVLDNSLLKKAFSWGIVLDSPVTLSAPVNELSLCCDGGCCEL